MTSRRTRSYSSIDMQMFTRSMSYSGRGCLPRIPIRSSKVQKTQISFYNRRLYACVSFLRVKRKAELPEVYFVLTLGLATRLDSPRVAAIAEPYPGRWTTHFVISDPPDLDAEMYGWIDQAYEFANPK